MKKKSAEPIEPETNEAIETEETETPLLPESLSVPQINDALRLRARGLSIREIAAQTGLSEATTGRLLKGVGKEAAMRLVSSLPIEATKPLSNLEVGEFVPETFQGDLYHILRNAMRFNVWFNSLPDELKHLVVKPSQPQRDGQKTEQDILSAGDIKKLVLLRFISEGKPAERQSVEQETQRIMSVFKSLRDLEQGAVQQHKQVEEEVRRSLQPEKSGIEKVGEALRVINKEATPILEKVGSLVKGSQTGPPPPQTAPPIITEEQVEAAQLSKVEGTPPKLSNLLEENSGTFSEGGLPPEESQESAVEESHEPVGGSVSEVEKRLRGEKK